MSAISRSKDLVLSSTRPDLTLSRVIASVNAAAWESTGGKNSGTILIGNLIKEYAFDGLGRLARTVSPYPNPAAAGGFNRTERLYFDGIRCMQEIDADPWPPSSPPPLHNPLPLPNASHPHFP